MCVCVCVSLYVSMCVSVCMSVCVCVCGIWIMSARGGQKRPGIDSPGGRVIGGCEPSHMDAGDCSLVLGVNS